MNVGRIVIVRATACLACGMGFAAGEPAPQSPGSNDVSLKDLRPSHPRLILTKERIAALRGLVASDPVAADYLAQIRRRGAAMLKQAPVTRTPDPRGHILGVSRRAQRRIATLAFLYRMDGDRQWADRAIAELRAVSGFADWHPPHFLDVADMTIGVAIGYDWLYDVLTPEDRALIRNALTDKGLKEGLSCFARAPARQPGETRPGWWVPTKGNWNTVCDGAMIMGALALADETPEIAADLVPKALENLPNALSLYAPDGGWREGTMYWDGATRYLLYTAFTLQSALGIDYEGMNEPGIRVTGNYPLALEGPTATFNYADCWESPRRPRTVFYGLASWFRDPALAYVAREKWAGRGEAGPFDLIWYSPDGTAQDLAGMPRDFLFRRIQVATMRSAWNDPNAVFLGLKGGSATSDGHSHLDAGTFVFDADGVRWARDIGGDNYALPGYFGKLRFTYYRLTTAGHNTLLLDGRNQDQKARAAEITAFHSSADQAFAIVDLTGLYAPAGATRVRRGGALLNGRRHLLIQDEIETRAPVDVVWTMHTGAADLAVAPDGAHATLTRERKTCRVRLLAPPGARFTAERYRVSGGVLVEPTPEKGDWKLLIRLDKKTAAARIAVFFSPGSAEAKTPPLTALAEWK
ncbi:MAG: heparinase II/III family protein [Kiritimatiellae bacterium]|nr:heparinase II/III family protein [Kiritimatiellia bacterium]